MLFLLSLQGLIWFYCLLKSYIYTAMLYLLQRLQRIQHLFLVLAALSLFLIFALPFATLSSPSTEGIWADARFDLYDNIGALALVLIAGLSNLASIFLFKNLGLQLKVATLNAVLALALAGMVWALALGQDGAQWGAGLFVPVVSAGLSFAARFGIKADDKLIRSMDRLR
jgi:hypothetical protein